MKFGADQTLVTPSISFWRRSDLATERRVRASLKRTSRPSQRKLSRILQANYETGRSSDCALLTCWRGTRTQKKWIVWETSGWQTGWCGLPETDEKINYWIHNNLKCCWILPENVRGGLAYAVQWEYQADTYTVQAPSCLAWTSPACRNPSSFWQEQQSFPLLASASAATQR